MKAPERYKICPVSGIPEWLGSGRRAVSPHATGWEVEDSQFITTDPVLADAVARELDRIDPLPDALDWFVRHGDPRGNP